MAALGLYRQKRGSIYDLPYPHHLGGLWTGRFWAAKPGVAGGR